MPNDKAEARGSSEFLVFDIGTGAKVGGSYALLGTAATMAGAEEVVRNLPSAGATRVAIVERKAVLVRRPAVEVVPTADPVVADRN